MNIKKHIPNAITCCNLLCGCIAIVCAFEGNLVYSAYLVGLAAIFDFFDGFAARMLKVSSPIGKDLDSLADMVTFGVVPGVMMFQLIKLAVFFLVMGDLTIDGPASNGWTIYPPLSAIPSSSSMQFKPSHSNEYYDLISNITPYFAFIITVFSAIRLAKFNNDTRQSESFIGLPTPANAILICSFPLITDFSHNELLKNIIYNVYFLIPLVIVLSILLISELPLFALKFKHFKWQGNQIRYLFLGLSLLLLITLQFIGIPLTIILYIVMSLIHNVMTKNKTQQV